MRDRVTSSIAILCALTLGCDDHDGVVSGDASAADASIDPSLPAAAEPPQPVTLTPCPPGWRPLADATGFESCEPWPKGGHARCDDLGQAHFPGEPACRIVGQACPTGDFASDLPASATILFVRPGSAGGDGTPARPFGTIREAMALAAPGTIVALAKGRYSEPVYPRDGVTLWGACAGETLLTTTSATAAEGAVHVFTGGATLRNVRIGPSPRPGVWIAAGASLIVEGVVIDQATSLGIQVDGGTLDASEIVIRSTVERADGLYGRALNVQHGGTARLRRAMLEANRDVSAVATDPGTTIVLEDAGIIATLSRVSDGHFGRALDVESGARIEARRVVVEGAHREAIYATDIGSSLALEDVVVRDTESSSDTGSLGEGMRLVLGASADLRRVVLERNRYVALGCEGAHLDAQDLVIRDTEGTALDAVGGWAMQAQEGCSLTLARAIVLQNRGIAIAIGDEGTSADLADLVIRDTRTDAIGELGRGLMIVTGASVTVTRALLERNREIAVVVSDPGTTARLDDLVVRDTRGDSEGGYGRALHVQLGASSSVTRALFEGNREIAVFVSMTATEVTLRDLRIADVLPRECVTTSCPRSPAGHGVGAYAGARVTVSEFAITRAASCGVQLASDGEMDLHDGEIAESAIGACVQSDGFDLERLSATVRFRDNGTNLQTTDLPIPDDLPPIGP